MRAPGPRASDAQRRVRTADPLSQGRERREASVARFARRMRAVLCAALLASPAAAQDWRALDPENTLVIDTTKGRMIVEMRPEIAPKAVERIKLLAREGVYDGLQFHRVIEGFVAQTGNPNNKDGGVSRHPDLPPEFTFKLTIKEIECPEPSEGEIYVHCRLYPYTPVARASDGILGLVGSIPVVGEVVPVMTLRGWGAYCAGVAGMGRQADPRSANSEIFFMLKPERRLDHEYTTWGRVVVGQEVLAQLARGEPPAEPDRMSRVRVGADLSSAERPTVEVEDGVALTRRIHELRKRKGADFSICDVTPAARVTP